MNARPTPSLSSIPGFDPRRTPIEAEPEPLPPVKAERLTVPALRRRFEQPPLWQPEFVRDPFRFGERPLRPAAVLIGIVDDPAGTQVLLTERSAHLNSHAGQVAFPGGRQDPEDANLRATALREASEEVGLQAGWVDLLGEMPSYVTGTGYEVTPVVGIVRRGFALSPNPGEVADVFEVPLSFLMDSGHHQRHRVRWEGGERVYYSIPFKPSDSAREHFIWGATAAMLRNLYRFLSA